MTALLVFAFWAPPILAISANRLAPDISTALGVPYAFLIGLVLGLAMTGFVALAAWRWPSLKPSYPVIAGAAVITIVLFVVAEQGALSVVR